MFFKRCAGMTMALLMLLAIGCKGSDGGADAEGTPDPGNEITISPGDDLEEPNEDGSSDSGSASEERIEADPSNYTTLCAFVVECEDTINLRSDASSHADLVRTLSVGERVNVVDYVERYAMVEVIETGETGYVIAGYLRPEEDVVGLSIVKPAAVYPYEKLMEDIAALKAAYPDTLTVESIGKSGQDRDIPVLIIGDRNAEKHVLIQAAIHGREYMTSLLVMAQSEAWLKDPAVGGVCFHVIPMSNPDGVSICHMTEFDDYFRRMYSDDLILLQTDADGLQYLYEWKANYGGVDLNRNFDAGWENIRTTEGPSCADYRGPSIGSEPETKALVAYTQRYPFAATISYHAAGSMIFWEFGEDSPVNEASHGLAAVIAKLSAYTLKGFDGISFGGYKDWANAKLGIPSLTIEIGTRAAPLPETDFYNIWLRNRHVFRALANWAGGNGA